MKGAEAHLGMRIIGAWGLGEARLLAIPVIRRGG